MSEKQISENLISGYVDNELSPAERAEAEKLMQSTPELLRLKDELEVQSNQISQLPRYSLGNDFAARLLDDERVDQAFLEIENVQSADHVAKTYGNSNRFGLAFSAIASLAALVLITLFVKPLPETNVHSAALEVSDANAFSDEAKSESKSKLANGLALELGEIQKYESKNESLTREPSSQVDDEAIELSENSIAGRKSMANDNIARFHKSDDSSRDVPAIGKFVQRNQALSEEAPVDSMALKREKPLPSGQVDEPSKSRGYAKKVDSFEKKKNARQIADNLQPSTGTAVDNMRREKNGLQQKVAAQKDSPDFINASSDVDQVIQVFFSNGTEAKMLDKLGRCLRANSIVLNEPSQLIENLVTNSKLATRAGLVGGSGGGGRGGGGGFGGGNNSEAAWDKKTWELTQDYLTQNLQRQSSENTLSLFVTTTPQQIKSLVNDLRDQAKVETIKLPEISANYFAIPLALDEANSKGVQLEDEENSRFKNKAQDGKRNRESLNLLQAPAKALEGRPFRGHGIALKNLELLQQGATDLSRTEDDLDSVESNGLGMESESKQPALSSREIPRNYLLLVRGSTVDESKDEATKEVPPSKSKEK